MNNQLLSILCCPETKQELVLLNKEKITLINRAISAGDVTSRNGKKVIAKIDGALLRSDKVWLYPIREDIPIMLIDEAINFSSFE
jgi:uncharacterized protein YbaR (Trm112 family)